jgi:hypothetical protein
MVQGFLNRNSFKTKETIVNEYKAFDSETITVDATVKLLNLTVGKRKDAKAIHVYVNSTLVGKALRYTYDGSTPSVGVGIARQDNDEFILSEFSNLEKFRVTREAVGTTTIFITYLV